jgi:hypothetical protein
MSYRVPFGGNESDVRSWLRKRDKWRAANPLHDEHVRALLDAYTPTMRNPWQCPRCGKVLRRGDVPRTAAGKLNKRNCGCSNGSRTGFIKHKALGVNTKSKEFKRLAKIMALPGYKAAKHDAHVKDWSRKKKEDAQALIVKRKKHAMPKEEIAQRMRDRDNLNTKLITDKYVRHLVVKSLPVLKGAKLPQSLIDLERARLLIVREIASRRILDEELQ